MASSSSGGHDGSTRVNFDSLLQSNVTLGGANELPDLQAGVWKEIFGDGKTAVEGHSFEGPILPTSLSLTFGSEGADDSALKRRRMGLEVDPHLMAIKDKPDETWQDSSAAKLDKGLARWATILVSWAGAGSQIDACKKVAERPRTTRDGWLLPALQGSLHSDQEVWVHF